MGVREKINNNPKLGVGVGSGILLLGVLFITFQLWAGRTSSGTAPDVAYYSDDDGKTFFQDDALKVVPFDRNGKKAYKADVFQCPDGKRFVGLLFRHTPGGKAEMQDYISQNAAATDKGGQFLRQLEYRGMDVKRAGAPEKAWVRNDEMLVETMRSSMKCGTSGLATLVTP